MDAESKRVLEYRHSEKGQKCLWLVSSALVCEVLCGPVTFFMGFLFLHAIPPKVIGVLGLLCPLCGSVIISIIAIVQLQRFGHEYRKPLVGAILGVGIFFGWPVASWLALFYMRMFF